MPARLSAIAVLFLGVCISAAYAGADDNHSCSAYATPVCPPGADSSNCLDNAYRAINDLERRVYALETGRRASSYASIQAPQANGAATQAHVENASTSTAGLSGIFHHPDCLVGWSWNGTTCVRRESD